MSLKTASNEILQQLADVIGQLDAPSYSQPLDVLSGNTIGKHVRHMLEFYQLLIGSVASGRLNYDSRPRDLRLEIDAHEALRCIALLNGAVYRLDLNRPLNLEANLSVGFEKPVQTASSVARELLYNIEHAIHHLALLRVALQTTFPHVVLPAHFGVAYSTVQYQAQ